MPYETEKLNIIGYAKPHSFEITSGRMIVTDPCYNKEVGCLSKLDNVKIGKWQATVAYSDEGRWGQRVAQILVWHDSLNIDKPDQNFPLCKERDPYGIGVDSGQAGFFDLEKYPDDPHNDSDFYDTVCKLTLSGVPYRVLEDVGYIVTKNDKPLTDDQKAKRESSDYSKRNSYWRQQYCGGVEDLQPTVDTTKLPDAIESWGSLGSFGVVPFGAVSSTGFGDGGYELFIERNSLGEMIAGYITFIEEEEEEED